jgi:DNA topoisomerase VI subunit B
MISESVKELATALAKAQAQLKPAIKDSTNPHFKSKYADLGAVWDACRKVLADNGLSIVQMPTDSTEGRVGLTTVLMHTSGEYIGTTVSTRLQQDSAQGVGSALTYLRRYALASMVGVVADEDDDGNAASQPRQQEQRPAANGNVAPKASDKQIKMLFAIWKRAEYEGELQDWIQNEYGCKIDALSMKDASAAIETLQPKDA